MEEEEEEEKEEEEEQEEEEELALFSQQKMRPRKILEAMLPRSTSDAPGSYMPSPFSFIKGMTWSDLPK